MATSIVMPALEMAQETGKIVSWLKKEGDTVSKGEILLEVETDKAVVEVEADGDEVRADPEKWKSPFSGHTSPIRVQCALVKGASA